MLDDPAVLLGRPREEARHVDEGQQRDVEGVAEADEARSLDRGVDVEAAGEDRGLVRHDADGPPVHPREPDDDVSRVVLLDLEEIPVVRDLPDHVPDVVRLRRDVGDHLVQALVRAVRGVLRRHGGGIFHVVLRDEGEQLPDEIETLLLVLGREVGHAAALVVGHRAAEVLLGDLLVGDRLDDVRARHEHVGSVLDHQDEVGDRGGVDGAAGARPHDRGDLGDDPRAEGVPQEDVGVSGEALDPLLDARAAGVVQADDRGPVATAWSMILQIFSAYASEREPPYTVKSWAKT